jgi:hypothetical protein
LIAPARPIYHESVISSSSSGVIEKWFDLVMVIFAPPAYSCIRKEYNNEYVSKTNLNGFSSYRLSIAGRIYFDDALRCGRWACG